MSDIKMQEVESSNVTHVGYKDGVLAVTFKGGKTYHYSDVPAEIHAGLMSAESVGKYLRGHVIGKFDHEKQD